MSYYTIQDAAELIGVSYNRLWYAVITGRITESRRVGRLRLFDDFDIAVIRQYFVERERPVKPTGSTPPFSDGKVARKDRWEQ